MERIASGFGAEYASRLRNRVGEVSIDLPNQPANTKRDAKPHAHERSEEGHDDQDLESTHDSRPCP
jgi:hypothetical protein